MVWKLVVWVTVELRQVQLLRHVPIYRLSRWTVPPRIMAGPFPRQATRADRVWEALSSKSHALQLYCEQGHNRKHESSYIFAF